MKIEIDIPEEEYKKLKKISLAKEVNISDLISEDLSNLLRFYKHQFKTIGIKL